MATEFNFEKILKQDISKEKKKKTAEISTNDLENSIFSSIQEVSESKSLNSTIKENVNLNQEVQSQPVTDNEIKFINSALKNHFLFTELSNNVLDKLTAELFIFRICAGDILYKEGDCGYFFFIVKQGKFQMISENNQVSHSLILEEGDTFGEDALLQMSKRTENVKCLEAAEVYLLDGKIFRETVYTINKLDYKERVHFLKLIPMFRWIDQSELRNLSDSLIKCEYSSQKIIEREGFQGDSLFIVIDGRVKCMKKDNCVAVIENQGYIGEAFIMFGTNWPFDLITDSKVKCYRLFKKDIIKGLGEDYSSILLDGICKEAFNSTNRLKYLMINVNNVFSRILTCFRNHSYKKDSIVCSKELYLLKPKIIIVIEGKFIYQNNQRIAANRGELFGEEYISQQEETSPSSLSTNIIASENCQTYEVDWDEIIQCLGCPNIDKDNILKFYERLYHMKKIEMFKNFSDKELFEISKLMKQKTYMKDEVIIQENTEGANIYFLYKGIVHIYHQGKKLREYQDYVCFGEISLLNNQPHTATVVSVEEASVYILSKGDFTQILNSNMTSYLAKKISLMDNNSLQLEDLMFIKRLGEGKFGHVSLVHDNKNVFAIKAVNKQFAQKKRILTKYFLKERNVLLTLDHPFIIKLVRTFHNNEFVFYLMEYVNGIELSRHLSRRSEKNLRKKQETQFYIASILIIINYLHQKHIAHRDIKAENIMIDELGYLKLIDFNTCGVIKDITGTIVGTPHYMAPELLLGKGYSFSVDYWSIGILAYKIYLGFFPFGNGMGNPMQVYHDIIQKELRIPFNVDEDFGGFITKILNKKPNERLVNYEHAKTNKFFSNFNWDELVDMKMVTPFTPQTSIETEELLKASNTETYLQMLSKVIISF